MRIFKTKTFRRSIKKTEIDDNDLLSLIEDIKNGDLKENLGGGLIKKRLARKGQGKSGGYRTILAYKEKGNVFFLFAFAKNEADNIPENLLNTFKKQGKDYQDFDSQKLSEAIKKKILEEI